MELKEVSPNTPRGSFSDDLLISKLWLIRKLAKIRDHFDIAYILGSWYGNLSLVLDMSNITVDKFINVDTDSEVIKKGEKLARLAGIDDRTETMIKDANTLDYRQLTKNSIVINCSLNNIKGDNWFQNIPNGTLVLMQGRDNDEDNPYFSTEEILREYPLNRVMYKGELRLKDPETGYMRYMVIGKK